MTHDEMRAEYEANLLDLAKNLSDPEMAMYDKTHPEMMFEVRAKRLELQNLPPEEHKQQLMALIQNRSGYMQTSRTPNTDKQAPLALRMAELRKAAPAATKQPVMRVRSLDPEGLSSPFLSSEADPSKPN